MSARLDAPISTGRVTKVKATAAPKAMSPIQARPRILSQTPAMISHGATPDPSWTAGTIDWRATIQGSPCRSWSACPTSWAMTAAEATDRCAVAGCAGLGCAPLASSRGSATVVLTRSTLPRGS